MNRASCGCMAAVLVVGALGLSACGSSVERTAGAASSAAAGAPGAPPGSGATQTAAKGTRAVSGGVQSLAGDSVNATASDTSGVLVTGGGTLGITDATITTSGSSSSSDQSSFYGLDAGVLAQGGSSVTMSGGSVRTVGEGANGVFADGTGTAITLAGTSVSATGKYAHGIMASGGGAITATGVTVRTTGSNGAAIATDRGGGTLTVTGGTYSTSGVDPPGIYSTGTIALDGAGVAASGAEAAVIEGSNAVTATGSTLSGAAESGVMIYQSFSGDAAGASGTFTMTGGSLEAKAGPLFLVTNSTATILLKHVTAKAASGVLVDAAAQQWGTRGSNGGTADLQAIGQTLTGDVVVDAISAASLTLSEGSAWTGAINAARTAGTTTVTLDASSTWTLTADSTVTTLKGAVVAGTTVTNIVSHGHTIRYGPASPGLGGKTYTLAGGGTLTPA